MTISPANRAIQIAWNHGWAITVNGQGFTQMKLAGAYHMRTEIHIDHVTGAVTAVRLAG
jgi:hypothetical protein